MEREERKANKKETKKGRKGHLEGVKRNRSDKNEIIKEKNRKQKGSRKKTEREKRDTNRKETKTGRKDIYELRENGMIEMG